MNDCNSDLRENDVTIVPTSCLHNCGGRCLLRVHVKNGKLIRVETDNGEEPQLRACAGGRSYRQRLYAPDRLLYPLRRVGERGEGRFVRISWENALGTVASRMLKIKETYGNAAILLLAGSGNFGGVIHGRGPVQKLLSRFGGFTSTWGSASVEGTLFASLATYGTVNTGNSEDDFLNSRLIILWGWNPSETRLGQPTSLYLAQARERGTRIIAVDPRYTDSAATFAQQWIPIRPGTDTAMFTAMAYVIITENLHDQAFIDKYTTGFNEYKSYVLGIEDGVPKTPQWAEEITSVPAEKIASLARTYATSKPAALVLGWGPARSAMGEQCARAANVLTAVTGNIGINGGFACGVMYYGGRGSRGVRSAESSNPVERGKPPIHSALYKIEEATVPCTAQIHGNKVPDAILRGRAGGYPADIKMAYVVASNFLNQRDNIPRAAEAFKSLDFVVVHEQFMTATAKFADIVLPVNTFLERSDIASSNQARFYLPAVVESLGESKTDLEICRELSTKLGIPGASGKETEADMLAGIANTRGINMEVLKRDGVIKYRRPRPVVAFQKQIEDIEHNPFPTPSGKIELYSEHIAEMNDPLLSPIPRYMSHWENYDDALTTRYPLQLITPHYKLRVHSTYDNLPWLKELEPDVVWISTQDAGARGIHDDDMVEVFNDRGRTRTRAKVTPRIMPGVVSIYQGTWYQPDDEGVDCRGSANVLTNDEQSPAGAYPFNTALVQIELIEPQTGSLH